MAKKSMIEREKKRQKLVDQVRHQAGCFESDRK